MVNGGIAFDMGLKLIKTGWIGKEASFAPRGCKNKNNNKIWIYPAAAAVSNAPIKIKVEYTVWENESSQNSRSAHVRVSW